MRANLALLGVESRLQRVSIDDDVYHRVRIGPTSDLDELNGVRRRLWDAEIDVLLIKVPD
jgi:cell division protein FtsN